MAKDGELHSMDLKGYWMDVGQPKDYLIGLGLYLGSLEKKKPELLLKGESVKGNVLIDPTAKLGKNCLIGPDVTIGANVVIEDGARIIRSAVLEGARIKAHSYVSSTIIGWRATVGSWSRVEGGAVLGDDVAVGDELYINGAIVLPNKSLSASITSPQIIM